MAPHTGPNPVTMIPGLHEKTPPRLDPPSRAAAPLESTSKSQAVPAPSSEEFGSSIEWEAVEALAKATARVEHRTALQPNLTSGPIQTVDDFGSPIDWDAVEVHTSVGRASTRFVGGNVAPTLIWPTQTGGGVELGRALDKAANVRETVIWVEEALGEMARQQTEVREILVATGELQKRLAGSVERMKELLLSQGETRAVIEGIMGGISGILDG